MYVILQRNVSPPFKFETPFRLSKLSKKNYLAYKGSAHSYFYNNENIRTKQKQTLSQRKLKKGRFLRTNSSVILFF